jgi:hypothetical protein
MTGYPAIHMLPDMDFLASPDARWSEILFQPTPDAPPSPLFHAHRVVDGEPSSLSVCTMYQSEGPFVAWEPNPGVRCKRCESAIDKL